ncbi:hypothetical protein EJ110_NYTH12603 [Nymphaea thermarum]|nr:hypothetical protein EJ110_NYTH12603 [Nymphaea thermarum]
MALTENGRQSFLPSFLYSSSAFSSLNNPSPASSLMSSSMSSAAGSFVVAAPSEPAGKIAMYSPAFYAASAVAGGFSTGLTHTAVTPIDLVKCNMQAVCV